MVRTLSTAEDRRETVLSTAISAFAARGYFGTTTVEVARAAGISQAYLYRLFPDKETLFAAVVERCFARIQESFAQGADVAAGTDGTSAPSPAEVLHAMGGAYANLIADQDLLLLQMHAQCAAISVPEVKRAVREGYERLVEYASGVSGAPEKDVQAFFATGALCTVVVSMGAHEVDAPWARTLNADLRH
ncbi:TetR/AcrR family transcriptional regulator [Cryptosporangium aurantiacum]|uniref:Transcriptional regulator, TetR family n=1 Tax=Cryptosporangium aurantiacum TaxID=134849 RepID=A0A1M7QCF9_9ACTN|nr:TetR/AcrR family transcriptional regulator [Cryptosporangium aurantiacum]SHN28441.1 transcriptional regulator, TetR family [Cryptosporangium aurantiacum]